MQRFKDHAGETADRICTTLGVSPTAAQRAAIVEMIEQRLVDNAIDTRRWCADHAMRSGAKGSQLADEMRSAHKALLANLSSMR